MKHKYFKLAKKMASKSQYHQQIGAVIVNRNDVVSVGYNQTKTHPKSPQPIWKTIHAEADCVIFADPKDLQGSDIYVYREYKSGKPATAKPCSDCWAFLAHAGVKRVHYTCSVNGYTTETIG